MKNKTKLYLIAVTVSVMLAVVWAVVAVPDTAQAKGKPSSGGGGGGGGGGDGDNGPLPVCVTFEDLIDDRIQSDGKGDYCNNSEKALAVIGSSGGFRLGYRRLARQTQSMVRFQRPGCTRRH